MTSSRLPIARVFLGFLLITGVITLFLAGAGVWYTSRAVLEDRQDDRLRAEAQAFADAYALTIDATIRALLYMARRPQVTQAIMGEEANLANVSDYARSFDIDPAILSIALYDILREPVVDEALVPAPILHFSEEARRALADRLLDGARDGLIDHVARNGHDHLLVVLPIRVYGSLEGALVAELRLPVLSVLTEQAEFSSVVIEKRVGRTRAASDLVSVPIGGLGLSLVLQPDRSVLGAAQQVILVRVLLALAAALWIAFAFAYLVGRKLIVHPQKLIEESRRRLLQSEAKARELASIVQQLNDAVAVSDVEGRVIWCNAACEILTGYTLDEMMGRKPGDLLQGPDTDPATVRAIREALHARQPHHCEIYNYRKDGSGYWVDINISPLFDPSGELRGFSAIQRVVSDVKEREAQLSAAREAAEAAAEAKSNFLASMSHEIRTPMNGIVGMADLLLDTRLDADQRTCADTIRDSAYALLAIINDVLDFSKIEAGKLVAQPEPTNVSRIIDDVAMLLTSTAAEKGVDLFVDDRINHRGGGARLFRTDPSRLRQILVNLVGNAVKFTDAGHVLITAEAGHPVQGMPAELRISVTDTGIGIAPDKLEAIFLAFEQAGLTGTRGHEGTGLGLAITKRLVGILGGEISVSSTPGEGSSFTVVVPLMEEVAGETGPAWPAELADKRVLVVSDHDVMQAILVHQVRSIGLEVGAISFADLVAAPPDPRAPIDVIIADQSPLMPGPARLRDSVRAVPALAGCPLVMLAPVGNTIEKDKLMGMGFAGVLTKPCRATTLRNHLQAALTGRPVTAEFSASRTEAPDLTGVRILIAEDNRTNLLVINRMLQRTGAECRFVGDGEAAVADCIAWRPDIVLMDCSMPILSGYDAARKIRERERQHVPGAPPLPPTPIIAITANLIAEDRTRCFACGMTDFIGKPITKAELYTVLTRALEGTRAPSLGNVPA